MKRAMVVAGAVLLSMSAQAEPFGAAAAPALRHDPVEQHAARLRHGCRADRARARTTAAICARASRQQIYLALRNIGGSGLIPYRHRLFLQFRHGRLAGWKEDYGENWMWE